MTWKALLQNLLVNDRIGDALKLLSQVCAHTNDNYNGDTLIAMQGRYNRLRRNVSQGGIRAEDESIEMNRLRIAAGDIAKNLDDFTAPEAWQQQFAASVASGPTTAGGGAAPTPVADAQRDTVLFLGASESAAPDLDIATEFNKLTRRLEGKEDAFYIRSELDTTIDNLTDVLLDKEPTILHISSHGTEADGEDPGGLVFEIEDVGLRAIAPENMRDLLEIVVVDQPIRLAVFNACHSFETARLSSNCIPHTIGLRDKIADTAALKFTSALYLALAKGYDVPRAYGLALNKLKILRVKASMLPSLFAGGEQVAV